MPFSTIEGVGFNDAGYQDAVTEVSGEVMDLLVNAELLSDGSIPGAGFSVGSGSAAAPGAIVVTITGDDASIRDAAMAAVAIISTDAPLTVTVVEGGGNTVFG